MQQLSGKYCLFCGVPLWAGEHYLCQYHRAALEILEGRKDRKRLFIRSIYGKIEVIAAQHAA